MAAGKWISYLKKLKKLKPYNIIKGIRYLKHFGLKEFLVRLSERMEPEEVPYGPWYKEHAADAQTLSRQKARVWKNRPLISIVVPLYHTPERFLREMIESVQAQSYDAWELCLANGSSDDEQLIRVVSEYAAKDSRIRLENLKENLGIAGNTNAALDMARGEYIGLLDHDDLLAPDALYEIASYLEKNPQAELIYTDEDKITAEGQEHFQPHLKPDFNLDLLRSNNYICHFCVIRTALVRKVGGFRREFDGAQDHDFILRCTEEAQKIGHVPRILYHWRVHSASTADNPASKMYAYEAGVRAVQEHLKRCATPGTVSMKKDLGFYRTSYPVRTRDLVSIVIPNKDEKETLQKCLESIYKKTTYDNYEILIVENNSVKEETFSFYKKIDGRNHTRVLYWDKPFNYSAINNFGIRHAKGEYIICLNNDMEIISPDWIEEMLGTCQREEVGAVGARLYYPDDTVQHAGIIIGIGGIAGSLFVGMKRNRSGYLHKADLMQDLSAVTAACLMVKKSVFEQVGGFEEKLAVAFNDVDFCLKIRQAGYLIVYDPYVELYHYESKTRGTENTKEKVRRFQGEIEYMRSHWTQILKEGDPYYNPNLSLSKWNYSLKPGKQQEAVKRTKRKNGMRNRKRK